MAEFDLIERDKIFEKVTELYRYSKGDMHIAYRELLDYILDIPAADVQPANHWISIKERLPESGQNVLIYYPQWDGDAVQVAKLDCDRITFDICGEFNVGVGVVTRWMPLPEPPKEGEQNE